MPLDHNFLIIGGVVQSQTKCCSSTAKCVISLKFERGLALWWSLSNIHQTQSSEKKFPYRGYSQIWSHIIMTMFMHASPEIIIEAL